MSNQQWQEGKTYQLKPDMIDEFKFANSSNPKIVELIGRNPFTVKEVSFAGTVTELVEYKLYNIQLVSWFIDYEIKYFDLVEATVESSTVTNTNNIRPNVDIVVEWLDKLQYVMDKDNSVDDRLCHKSDSLSLTTDFSDISGSNNIYTFITNRYDLLQQEAKYKKNNELMERKAKLEAELAEVNKELSNASNI